MLALKINTRYWKNMKISNSNKCSLLLGGFKKKLGFDLVLIEHLSIEQFLFQESSTKTGQLPVQDCVQYWCSNSLSATPRQRLYFSNTSSLCFKDPQACGTKHTQSEDGKEDCAVYSHPHSLARHKIAFTSFFFFFF